jgi:ectoine hydroxylase-related dioxygenase (phytanoyl-CoA dioxygenase family)
MHDHALKKSYTDNGYYFPLNVLPALAAADIAAKLSAIASSQIAGSLGYRGQLNHLHVVCPYISDLVRSPVIVDAVELILGPDILAWGSSLFLKPSRSPGFVSWHQDLTYWGLNNDKEVSVWIALGPAYKDNGCMRFVPGSHKAGQIDHIDTVDDANILTRGQNADVEVKEDETVYVELDPGQASLHHGHLLHASGPNNTDQPRIGLVVNYISTDVKQSVSKTDFAMPVRGEDKFNNFIHLPEPAKELDESGLAWHRKIVIAHNDALYDGAENMDSAPKH